MNHQPFKRILALVLVAALLGGFWVPGVQAASVGLTWKETDQKIVPDMTDRLVETNAEDPHDSNEIVRVSIIMEGKSTIQAGYSTSNIARNAGAQAYSAGLRSKQDTLAQTISTQILDGKKLDVKWNLTLVGNIISANVPYGKIDAIAQLDGVKDVILENTYAPCVVEREDVVNPQMYASLSMAGSSLVWNSGYTGAGSRIAILDTGTDTNHQSMDAGAYLYALEQNAQAAGISFEEYIAGLDLLDAQEIETVLPYLNIYEKDSSITAARLYLNEKLPFAVNYVDGNSSRYVVDHESDRQGEHGSHVAGIATANRYIPSGNGYADALETVLMAGTAPDAQLITMKVFGANGGPSDADYMAAIEDAIMLGCDSVNLSLGSSVAGAGFTPYFADLLEYMTTTDTVVVASAGNSYAWPTASPTGYLYSDDVNMDTVGSPGSYYSFLTVASVENDGGVGLSFNAAGHSVLYTDNADGSYYPMYTMDSSSDHSGTEYDFIFIDGVGNPEDYAGMDLNGKVVFCSRGSINFAEKANTAVSLGAAATVVYNNQSGIIYMDLTGYSYTAPCVSITLSDASAILAGATAETTADGVTYYTGKITVYGSPSGIINNSEYYTMSDFSSWGVPGDLSIKPEITAPGGNIYSLNGENINGGGYDQYELMSGTSMSAPQITGMVALMAQYLRESGLATQEDMSVRHLAQSLLMSTAVPMLEEASGNYYSILKQGAGLARVDLAATASSYILVKGQNDGKVKAELGDDPNRSGVYEFTFTINNLSGKAESYGLNADIFCQSVFGDSGVYFMDTWTASLPATASFRVNGTSVAPALDLSGYDLNGDGVTNVKDADYLLEYLLGNETTINGTADVNADGEVNTYDAHVLLEQLSNSGSFTVPANGSVTVDVCLTLTASAKQQLDALYPNGTYVQAYVYAESLSDSEGVAGTSHSIPVLAFYGNWSDARMFDYGTVVDMMYGNVDKMPYMYNETYFGTANALTIDFGDGDEYYFGGNPFLQDDDYLPERNAMNSEDASYLAYQYFTLIRNAGETQLVITNADTGEVYMQKSLGECYPAFYYVNGGYWTNVEQYVGIGWRGLDANGEPLPEDTRVEVHLIAIPEYYRNSDGTYSLRNLGDGVSLTTPITIDNTAPEMKNMELVDTTLTVTAQDNRHVAAVAVANLSGSTIYAAETPNQINANELVTVELDLAGIMGSSFLLAVYDYAGNITTYEVELDLPEIERPYFTAVDYSTNTYYGLSSDGATILLASGDRGPIRAAEFVDGYVFEVTADGCLYVASDDDLNNFKYLGSLDPNMEFGSFGFLDLAYSYAHDALFGLFYSSVNNSAVPYLCAIDMYSGQWEVLCEMPVDVNNMAIDDEGNFYSIGYSSTTLYTYTLDSLANGTATEVGGVGTYSTSSMNSLAWDHDADTLYWAYPDTLLQVDPQTAEPTVISYFDMTMVGLYIRPATWDDRFVPTNTVSSVTVEPAQVQLLVGNTISLNALVHPWTVSDDSVTWTSSDASVATVNENGMLTGVAKGTAVITATSNLDPTKQASCAVNVFTLGKELKALVWDEDGYVWWSSFSTDTLPSFTKNAGVEANVPLATTAVIDGTLYAASLDTSTGLSDLYTVDPSTYEATLIGGSAELCYTDMTYSPSLGYLLGTYFNYIVMIDPATGEYIGAWDWTEGLAGDLVGITYYGTQYNSNYGAYMDLFLILDAAGNVYLDAFIPYSGAYYYFNGPENGYIDIIGEAVDTPYFQSFYYDGSYAYWARFNEADNVVELLAWDCNNTGKVYTVGTFPDGVWPVGGLYSDAELSSVGTLAAGFKWATASTNAMTTDVETKVFSAPATGSLNSVVAPLSDGQYESDSKQITVNLTPAGDATNGLMTVTYDPSVMTLTGVSGTTAAFAWTEENGTVTVAFASADVVLEAQAFATLTFDVVKPGEHTITITHTESGDASCDKEEILTISVVCDHNYEDGFCTECGAEEPAYILGDVNGDGIVNILDANLAASYYNEVIDLTETQLLAADVNGDGIVNILDANLIAAYYNEVIDRFPAEK